MVWFRWEKCIPPGIPAAELRVGVPPIREDLLAMGNPVEEPAERQPGPEHNLGPHDSVVSEPIEAPRPSQPD